MGFRQKLNPGGFQLIVRETLRNKVGPYPGNTLKYMWLAFLACQ
jgi:hypothetical protein